jgi:serine/threonine protein kinase
MRRLGDFEVRSDKVLGRGAMGMVVQGRQISHRRPVAVKILDPMLAGDSIAVARFQREGRITSMLNPDCSIVAVLGSGHFRGTYFLALEFVDCGTLKDLMIRHGRPPLEATLHVAHRVAVALGEAHSKGVVHRDLKPSNVMVSRAGAVKVMDFGVAKVMGERLFSTLHEATWGTPAYMSPEQVAGKEADERSDIYSLGCICYELLTGRPPFEGDDLSELMSAHANEMPQSPRSLDPEIPEEVDGVVMRCLQKDARSRFSASSELESVLASLLAPVGGSDKILARWAAGGKQPALTRFVRRVVEKEPASQPPRKTPLPKVGRRRLLLAMVILGAVAAFSAMVTGLILLLQEPPPLPVQGTLVVGSDPPGAEVYVDGSPRGKTPETLTGMGPGVYSIRLRHPTRGEWTGNIVVQAGRSVKVDVNLPPPQDR